MSGVFSLVASLALMQGFTTQVVAVPAEKPAADAKADAKSKAAKKADIKPAAPAPAVPGVTLAAGDIRQGKLVQLADGVLILEGNVSIPLDDVAAVDLAQSPVLIARWIGQGAVDKVGAGGQTTPNGTADVELVVDGLSPVRQVSDVTVDAGFGKWSLKASAGGPPSRSRPAGGGGLFSLVGQILGASEPPKTGALIFERQAMAPSARIYFDPPALSLADQNVTVTVTHADGTKLSTKLTGRATDAKRKPGAEPTSNAASKPASKTETNDKAAKANEAAKTNKFDKSDKSARTDAEKTPAKADDVKSSPPRPAIVSLLLDGEDRVSGELVSWSPEEVALRTTWGGDWNVPLTRTRAVRFTRDASADADELFAKHLRQATEFDIVVARNPTGSLVTLNGRVLRVADGRLRLEYMASERGVALDRVVGVVLAARPAADRPKGPHHLFVLRSGDRFVGVWSSLQDAKCAVALPWGKTASVPLDSLSEIVTRNGRRVYLSELDPVTVEQIPYFDRVMPYRRDRDFSGGPIKVDGKAFARGLATHARCSITYDVADGFQSFHATLGVEESVRRGGRAAVRVIVDGVTKFQNDDLRRGMALPVNVDIVNARRLTLDVDFGQEEDMGDRVLWAGASLLRPSAAKPAPKTKE